MRFIIILLSFCLFSCVSFQTLTLDDHFDTEFSEESVVAGDSEAMFGKQKEKGRKIIMDQFTMLNSSNWYVCNKENSQIVSDYSGVKVVFNQALNDCFGVIFPATDIRGYPFLKINAGVKDYAHTDLFDLRVLVVDKNNNKSELLHSKYLIHDGKMHHLYLNLHDLALRVPALDVSAITQILFFTNTIQSKPMSGSLVISHIEFVRRED